jgi:hypothetical protein
MDEYFVAFLNLFNNSNDLAAGSPACDISLPYRELRILPDANDP